MEVIDRNDQAFSITDMAALARQIKKTFALVLLSIPEQKKSGKYTIIIQVVSKEGAVLDMMVVGHSNSIRGALSLAEDEGRAYESQYEESGDREKGEGMSEDEPCNDFNWRLNRLKEQLDELELEVEIAKVKLKLTGLQRKQECHDRPGANQRD